MEVKAIFTKLKRLVLGDGPVAVPVPIPVDPEPRRPVRRPAR